MLKNSIIDVNIMVNFHYCIIMVTIYKRMDLILWFVLSITFLYIYVVKNIRL